MISLWYLARVICDVYNHVLNPISTGLSDLINPAKPWVLNFNKYTRPVFKNLNDVSGFCAKIWLKLGLNLLRYTHKSGNNPIRCFRKIYGIKHDNGYIMNRYKQYFIIGNFSLPLTKGLPAPTKNFEGPLFFEKWMSIIFCKSHQISRSSHQP